MMMILMMMTTMTEILINFNRSILSKVFQKLFRIITIEKKKCSPTSKTPPKCHDDDDFEPQTMVYSL